MSLDKDRLGKKISDAVITASGLTPSAADRTKFEDNMKIIVDEIIKEWGSFAEIAAGSFTDSLSNPVTGIGGPTT